MSGPVDNTRMTADQVARLLNLAPHPEGGRFAETFRDTATDAHGRAASTAIHYMLARGERSHWHRVDAVEIWHFHAGDPLRLRLSDGEAAAEDHILGADLAAGQRPQIVVPAGAWQAAEPLAQHEIAGVEFGWTLVGCTVAPGFDFAGFEMAPPDWSPGA